MIAVKFEIYWSISCALGMEQEKIFPTFASHFFTLFADSYKFCEKNIEMQLKLI